MITVALVGCIGVGCLLLLLTALQMVGERRAARRAGDTMAATLADLELRRHAANPLLRDTLAQDLFSSAPRRADRGGGRPTMPPPDAP